MQNGHTSGDEREVWMERVNFDGQVTGETARRLIKAAQAQGRKPQELIQDALRQVLGDTLNAPTAERDITAEPMTINAGNGGFHVVTVVADGYGTLIAENSAGEERAKVKATNVGGEDIDPVGDLHKLITAWMGVEADPQG